MLSCQLSMPVLQCPMLACQHPALLYFRCVAAPCRTACHVACTPCSAWHPLDGQQRRAPYLHSALPASQADMLHKRMQPAANTALDAPWYWDVYCKDAITVYTAQSVADAGTGGAAA